MKIEHYTQLRERERHNVWESCVKGSIGDNHHERSAVEEPETD